MRCSPRSASTDQRPATSRKPQSPSTSPSIQRAHTFLALPSPSFSSRLLARCSLPRRCSAASKRPSLGRTFSPARSRVAGEQPRAVRVLVGHLELPRRSRGFSRCSPSLHTRPRKAPACSSTRTRSWRPVRGPSELPALVLDEAVVSGCQCVSLLESMIPGTETSRALRPGRKAENKKRRRGAPGPGMVRPGGAGSRPTGAPRSARRLPRRETSGGGAGLAAQLQEGRRHAAGQREFP